MQRVNLATHSSAFSKVKKDLEARSFIVIRDVPQKVTHKQEVNFLVPAETVRPQQRCELGDYDSTHHSGLTTPSLLKVSKEEKRQHQISSIMNLIESRKNDTLCELEKFSDDDLALKASPKVRAKNSKLSHFRGVSNNGRKWQVMIMGFAKKIYFGGIDTEDEASRKYDKYAILMHGLEVCYLLNFFANF